MASDILSDILSKINGIASAKSYIISAVEGKGVAVPDDTMLDEIPSYISKISVATGQDPLNPFNDVRFYDYDGTLLHSYALEDIELLNELPPLPKHYGLTCQGWNWTLDELKSISYGVNIGALYITDDEATKLHIEIPNTSMLTIPLCFNQTTSAGVAVDWGDGSTTETVSETGNVSLTHTYRRKGKYTISLLPNTSCTLKLGHTASGYNVLGEVNDSTRCISNMLKGVNYGRKVSTNASYAFQYCRSLEYVTFPNTVTSMGNYSFNNASSLKAVILPPKVTNIPTFTFGSCFALRTVSIPIKTTTLGASAFRYCHCLESVTIPPNVTTLNGFLFSECYCIKRVNLPSEITSIGNFVFDKCHALTEFEYPESVSTVGSNAFYQNYSLSEIDISDVTTSIGAYAFYDCHALTEIDIPAGLTEIKAYAFQNCFGLKKVWMRPTTPPTLSSSSFTGISDDCVIYIPAGTLSAYSAASGWSDYIDFLEETYSFPAF